MHYYLDTNIVIACYYPEKLSTKAQQLIDKISQPVISNLTEIEFHSALAKKVRAKELSKDNANEIAILFYKQVSEHQFKKTYLSTKHYSLALNRLAQFCAPLRTLDALQLAVAEHEELIMITSDQKLATSAKIFGLQIELLQERSH